MKDLSPKYRNPVNFIDPDGLFPWGQIFKGIQKLSKGAAGAAKGAGAAAKGASGAVKGAAAGVGKGAGKGAGKTTGKAAGKGKEGKGKTKTTRSKRFQKVYDEICIPQATKTLGRGGDSQSMQFWCEINRCLEDHGCPKGVYYN